MNVNINNKNHNNNNNNNSNNTNKGCVRHREAPRPSAMCSASSR